MEDKTQERKDGPTPNGGVYSIAYFLDADGSPVPKEQAVKMEIHEFDAEGNSIHRTYLHRTSPQASGQSPGS